MTPQERVHVLGLILLLVLADAGAWWYEGYPIGARLGEAYKTTIAWVVTDIGTIVVTLIVCALVGFTLLILYEPAPNEEGENGDDNI